MTFKVKTRDETTEGDSIGKDKDQALRPGVSHKKRRRRGGGNSKGDWEGKEQENPQRGSRKLSEKNKMHLGRGSDQVGQMLLMGQKD